MYPLSSLKIKHRSYLIHLLFNDSKSGLVIGLLHDLLATKVIKRVGPIFSK